MRHSFHPMGRALCALLLGATLTLSPLAAQAAPRATLGLLLIQTMK